MTSPDMPSLGNFPPPVGPNTQPIPDPAAYNVAPTPPTPEELKLQVRELVSKVASDYVPTVAEFEQYADLVSRIGLDGNKQVVKGREREGLLVDGQPIPDTAMSAKSLKRLKDYVNPRERVLDGQEVVYLEAIKRGDYPDYFKAQVSKEGVKMSDHDTAVTVANTIDRQLALHKYAQERAIRTPYYVAKDPTDPRAGEVLVLPQSDRMAALQEKVAAKAGQAAYDEALRTRDPNNPMDLSYAELQARQTYTAKLAELQRRRADTLRTSQAERIQRHLGDRALALTGADGKPAKGVPPILVDETQRSAPKPPQPAVAFARRMRAFKEDEQTWQEEQVRAELNEEMASYGRLARGVPNDSDIKRFIESYGGATVYEGDPNDVEAREAFAADLRARVSSAKKIITEVSQADVRRAAHLDREEKNMWLPDYWRTGSRDRHQRNAMSNAEGDSMDLLALKHDFEARARFAQQRRDDLTTAMERRRLTAMYGPVTQQVLKSVA